MDFPAWIDASRHSDVKRAQLRLKHMLLNAGLRRFGKTTFRSIAAEAGIDHSSMFCAIDRGYFTEPMARAIEAKFAPDVRAEWLMAPLEVGAKATA